MHFVVVVAISLVYIHYRGYKNVSCNTNRSFSFFKKETHLPKHCITQLLNSERKTKKRKKDLMQ